MTFKELPWCDKYDKEITLELLDGEGKKCSEEKKGCGNCEFFGYKIILEGST